MNEKTIESLILVGVYVCILILGFNTLIMSNIQTFGFEPIGKDLNTLKQNDLVFGQYIYQNSTALTFLNGCMQTKDNNTTIELTCKKV